MLTANEAWLQRLRQLIIAPEIEIRGMKVREEIACKVQVDMNYPFVVNEIRNISDKFRFAEAYWILSGDNRVETIRGAAPSIEFFSDNGHVFQGAYGPKVTEQLRYVCETLLKDPHSRQAVISIWRENPRDSKDIPCTLSLQFLIRYEELHCIATMRSSDVWLGLPYDIFNFSCISKWIQLYLCNDSLAFPPELGSLTINIGSSHLYAKNYEAAEKVLNGRFEEPDILQYEINEAMSPKAFMGWLKWGRNHA